MRNHTLRGACALSLSTLALLALPLSAQEPQPGKAGAPAITKSYDPARRVPNYFGQIGLTNDQRDSIYKIQAKHLLQVEELEKQIAGIKAQMISDCEGVLTPTQKQLVEARRKAALQGRPAAAAPALDTSTTKAQN